MCLTLGRPGYSKKFSPKTKLVSVNNLNHKFVTCKLEPSGMIFSEISIS